jgi:hypothetical protein
MRKFSWPSYCSCPVSCPVSTSCPSSTQLIVLYAGYAEGRVGWAPFAGGSENGAGDVPCDGGAGQERFWFFLAVSPCAVHVVCRQRRVPSMCAPSRRVLDLATKVIPRSGEVSPARYWLPPLARHLAAAWHPPSWRPSAALYAGGLGGLRF